jgi:hypothetical protein
MGEKVKGRESRESRVVGQKVETTVLGVGGGGGGENSSMLLS